MTIIGQDDLLGPGLTSPSWTRLTRAQPDAGLYHAHFRFMDARGKVTRPCRALPARETAAEYLTALFTGKRDTYGTGYLMRSARYEAVGGIPPFEKLLFADDALWMALDGRFVQGDRARTLLLLPPAPGQRQRRHGLAVLARRHAPLCRLPGGPRRPRPRFCASLRRPRAHLLRRLAAVALDAGPDAGDPARIGVSGRMPWKPSRASPPGCRQAWGWTGGKSLRGGLQGCGRASGSTGEAGRAPPTTPMCAGGTGAAEPGARGSWRGRIRDAPGPEGPGHSGMKVAPRLRNERGNRHRHQSLTPEGFSLNSRPALQGR